MIDLQGFGSVLFSGAVVTVKLALTSFVVGMVFGLLGAAAKLSKVRFLRVLGTLYTSIFRSIPELLLVLFIYFGFSIVLNAVLDGFGLSSSMGLSPFVAGVIALSLAFGAYATETLRMAIIEIPKGQWESAQAIGLNPVQTFRIILPQVWRIALPGLGNLFLVLLKDTALVSVIGLNDLMRQSSVAVGAIKEPFTVYMAVALMYLTMTMFATLAMLWLERWSDPAGTALKKAQKHHKKSASAV